MCVCFGELLCIVFSEVGFRERHQKNARRILADLSPIFGVYLCAVLHFMQIP